MKKEISNELVNLINKEEFKKALNTYNFTECYKILHDNNLTLISQFTELLLNTGINPLEYMVYIPINFLSDSSNVKTFEIPSNIKSIKNWAFYSCKSLESITIPNSVTSIGIYAFYNCTSLNYNVYDDAYYLGNSDNPYLLLVKARYTNITSCIINENCKFITNDAFYGCKLLTTINYNGTITQWNAISKGTDWHTDVPATTVHCTDGDVEI